ncbi:MAG: type I-U CRISPR-associated helicase/endonuclease Cas3 [Acidimicrobiaceae bacterium]|nr:type I-U CRISPR-associated helicase/endonuclease Cas3 [Acidimicrobiaceae bacterium]
MRITQSYTWTDGERWLSEALGLPNSDTPFPWQRKLLRCFSQGKIPGHLDIPTGLGKTSVMAIWLIARALGADLPRRLVYVVDRRAVVDQSTDVALLLRHYVNQNPEFKSALGLSSPLPISTLRGQHIDNREWLKDPTLPAIIVGTVDMIGSRLLFEGYGTTPKMRPYQAGLLGSDVLVVLDEAHLVPPFEKLLKAIAIGASTFGPQNGLAELIPPFRLMTLTATAHSNGDKPFGLTPEDLEHEVAKQRLHATKRLRLESLSDPRKLSETLAHHAWELTENGRSAKRIIVFCDKPRDAEKARATVNKWAKGNRKRGITSCKVDTELFVGGRRVYEREEAAKWLRERGFIPDWEEEPETGIRQMRPGLLSDAGLEAQRPAFVFATSAGEVGVDLDADHMVCDLVAWERMVQRLGRVNRRGEGCASVTVVHNEQNSENTQLKALKLLPEEDGRFDASTEVIRSLRERATTDAVLKQVLDDASTKPPLHPALSRALLDAWSMTWLKKHTGRPDVQPWLRGWDEDPPQTTVVWRKHLPMRIGESPTSKKEIEDYFEAAAPHMSEKLETYTSEVFTWMQKRATALLKASSDEKDSQSKAANDTVTIVLNAAGEMKTTFSLEDFDVSRLDTKTRGKKKKEIKSVLAGATLVVDARIAGLSEGGRLNNTENSPPRTADDGSEWLTSNDGVPVTRFSVRKENATDDEQGDVDIPTPAAGWRQCFRFATELSEDGEERQWLAVYKWRGDASMEDDRSTGAGPPQLLEEHQQYAEECVRAIAQKIGLPNDYTEMLAIAAMLHDEGKRSQRWQRAFNAPQDGGIYAKTRGPINYRLLGGYRHEFGSLAHAERDASLVALPDDLRDLALHLVASHHGFARPVIRVDGCEDAPPSVLEERAREVAMRFARLQKHWGPWGLAWWESMLRSADWQASGKNEHRDGKNNERKTT